LPRESNKRVGGVEKKGAPRSWNITIAKKSQIAYESRPGASHVTQHMQMKRGGNHVHRKGIFTLGKKNQLPFAYGTGFPYANGRLGYHCKWEPSANGR